MARIHFVKKRNSLDVPDGANLMDSLLDAKIPVASSCHGDGVCCKCVVTIQQGIENLSAKNSVEINLGERNRLQPNQRVSCQTQILKGDVTLDAGYW